MNRMSASGFTLLEVLVAVFVTALGVIGAAGMQLSALRARQQSVYLSDALHIAAGMADKIRANAPRSPAGNPYLGADYAAVNGAPPAPGALCHDADAQCDREQLARADLYEAMRQVYVGLPGGRMRICRDGGVWDDGQRALTWACAGGVDAPLVVKLGWRARKPDGGEAREGAPPDPPGVAIALGGGL